LKSGEERSEEDGEGQECNFYIALVSSSLLWLLCQNSDILNTS
jgi:hypothetical protein